MSSHASASLSAKREDLLRIPEWERYGWLRAGFSTRQGGCSQVYGADEQNLGWTKEDDTRRVAANREAFVARVGAGAPMEMVTSQQVHGREIRNLDREAAPWMLPNGRALREADGLVTSRPGQLLAVLTADCAPILIADTRLRVVCALHAGWRGTLARIVSHGIAAMRGSYGCRPEDLVAAIGPCIGPCCFEVGPELRSCFSAEGHATDELFQQAEATDRLRMDLPQANRMQLLEAGLAPDSVVSLSRCTCCYRTPSGQRAFFTYRGEKGVTGRMLSGIAVAPTEV